MVRTLVQSFIADRHRGRAIRPSMLLMSIVAIFLSAASVVALAHFAGHVTGIWIANAVFVAILLHHRTVDWPIIAIAGLLANIVGDSIDYAPGMAILFAALNFLEVATVAVPVRLFRLDRDFTRSQSLLAFYAIAICLAPALGAGICGAIFYKLQGLPFLQTASDWYGADALGLVIVVPPLMTVRFSALKRMFRRDQIALTLALLGVVGGTIAFNYFFRSLPLAFLFFPAVVLLTFQRGFAGGAIGLAMTAAYLLILALVGQSSGPLHSHAIRDQVTIVQIFVAVMGFSVVLVGAALEERRNLEQGLAQAIARARASREEAIVAKDAAEKASRSKSMFLATMSHELRTPLNAVIGFAELMNSEVYGPLGDSRYREYSGVIQSAGRHLLDLINDILDMSKIEAGKHELDKEFLSVDEIVRECLDLMSEQALQSEVTLKAELPSAPFSVYADRRAIKQILLNIVSNAVKFTPANGSVVVRARAKEGQCVLAISDTGVGIPADQIYRLGNPFVQLRNNAGATGKGTGLGLALVRALSEMHGGTFKIESVEGHGTTVTVTIPLGSKAAMAA
jgi:signal transduction histidine kinase